METASTVECSGGVLNTDPFSASADCSCSTCAECGPNYPGCGLGDPEPKEPRILSGSRIVADHDSGLLTFEPPILPRAVVAPVVAEEGQTVTVYVLDLPTDVTGQVEVSLGGVVLGTVPTSAIDAGGEVSLTVPLPFGVLGEQRLSSGITGFAPRATTRVTITASLNFPDNDGDGIDDAADPDDDNDGVIDGNDSDPLNPFVCADTDSDTCDDCNSGSLAPLDDGPDFDLDGQCNTGDPDDDNDGVLDVIDGEPFNPNACGDIDNDLCDDCAVVSNVPSPNNDGPDSDGDGQCDVSDPNAQPIALCADVQVAADASCQANASVDAGSNDPEGLVQSLTETPGGPYGQGDTTVTLNITDTSGEFDECTGIVTVADTTDPTITACAADRTIVANEVSGTAALDDLTGEVTPTDACGILSVTQDPVAGTALAAGSHDITFTATDLGGNTVTCGAAVTVLDRVLSIDEKIKVRFNHHADGTECEDDDHGHGHGYQGDHSECNDDEEGAPVLQTPHCFDRLDLDGDLQLRDAATLPIDIRQPGSADVGARLLISLSGQVISDQMIVLDVKNANDEKWEYKRAGGTPKQGVKKLKLDWKETASYDSHDASGLGNDVARIETRFIGFDETDTKLHFKNVPRPFRVQFDDPVYGLPFVIDVLDNKGTATISPAGDYDLKDKKSSMTLVLPFRLTPDTSVTFTSDGGQTLVDIPVDTEFNYQPAGAKYKLDLDETTLSETLCIDETSPVNSMSSPELEVQLFIGNGQEEVVGIVLAGPTDWTRIDDRKWELKP
jgi:hypothetical protein